tara:strand:- start:4189 stop:5802 length:1614 start_codon:yes stop_codon:yes gene_type:complete
MALPSSGQISFSDLQTEYGGSNPISMSEFRSQNSNSSATDSGPDYFLCSMSFNSANDRLQFNSVEYTSGIALNDDMTIVLAKASGTWDNSNLYWSSTTDPGNVNLLTTGVTNNGTADGNIMTIDLSQYASSDTGTLVGYIKSDNTTGGTAVPVYNISDPGNVANRVNFLYAKAKFQFSDAGAYVGGSRSQKVTTKRQITDNETGVLIPAGGSIDFTSQINALPTVAAGGTYHYIYFQLYDTSYDSGTYITTFSNFRQIAWTNNVGFTNGSGSVITGSNNNATTVANLLATTAGYNVARNPNYTGTSESVSLQMTNSGSVLNGTITNNTGSDIALYRWQKASGSAPDRSSLWSLLWADSGSNFVNSHATAPTFTNHLREHYGYPTRLRLQYYFTPTGGSETNIGGFIHQFDDGMTEANCLNKIKTDNDGYFHNALDTVELYKYIQTTVVGDSLEFQYYLPGQLRVVAEYLVYGYSQGVVGDVHDGATQGQQNDSIAVFKSNESLTSSANGNFGVSKQLLNMSMSDYYNGRGSLTLGSG